MYVDSCEIQDGQVTQGGFSFQGTGTHAEIISTQIRHHYQRRLGGKVGSVAPTPWSSVRARGESSRRAVVLYIFAQEETLGHNHRLETPVHRVMTSTWNWRRPTADTLFTQESNKPFLSLTKDRMWASEISHRHEGFDQHSFRTDSETALFSPQVERLKGWSESDKRQKCDLVFTI